MLDTTRCFITWGIITFIFTVIATLTYLWLSRVARFENRKKEILIGMIVCVLVVSSLMFFPVLFARIDLRNIGNELTESISVAKEQAMKNGEKLQVVPFVKPFAKFLSLFPQKFAKYIYVIIFGIPALVSGLIIAFVIRIIFLIREPKKENEDEYKRKHLFEYNTEIVSELNRKK